MSDMTDTIIPRSDQLNADSLLTGPITIKVSGVEIAMGEQPVTVHYEGENGRPFKPGKTSRRVLVRCWGADASAYVGRSMTLYTDPDIKFGGMAVGGIRISHLSHIDSAITMALTETKGKKKPFTVRPLVVEPAPPAPSGRPTAATIIAAYKTRLAAAADLDAFKTIQGTDDDVIRIRAKGSDIQKAALVDAEAEVYEALIHKAPIPAASHIPGFDDAPGGEVG